MFKTILVPTDGSPLAEKAVDAAIEFARESGGRIVVISVAEPYPFAPLSEKAMNEELSTFENGVREAARNYVKKAADAARAAGVDCETVVVLSGSPYREIVDTANNMKCDAIFMASHGRRGLNLLFLGSETQKVLAHSNLPVMVFR